MSQRGFDFLPSTIRRIMKHRSTVVKFVHIVRILHHHYHHHDFVQKNKVLKITRATNGPNSTAETHSEGRGLHTVEV